MWKPKFPDLIEMNGITLYMIKWSLVRINIYLGLIKTNHSVNGLWKQVELDIRHENGSDLKETKTNEWQSHRLGKLCCNENQPIWPAVSSGHSEWFISWLFSELAGLSAKRYFKLCFLVCFIYCYIPMLGAVSAYRKGSINICCMWINIL